VAHLVEALHYKPEVPGFDFRLFLAAALWPWGIKVAGAWGRQSCYFQSPIVYKFWGSQTPGALRACPSLLEG